MTDFVEECRREWRRLRVPAESADEMADDLAADLREAEAEGAFLEEVLGDGAADPRAFAAEWARERGLVHPRRSDRLGGRGVLIGVALGDIALVGAVVAIVITSRESPPQVAPRPATTRVSFVGVAVSPSIVGSSVLAAQLEPGGMRLSPNVKSVRTLRRRPTSLTTWVRNSGTKEISDVTLVVHVYQRTYVRRIAQLERNHVREVTVPLPTRLPDTFTIRVSARPVRGERNLVNNSAAWRISLGP